MLWWELRICYIYHFFKEMFHKDTYQMQKLYICLDRDLPSKNYKWLGPLIQNLMRFHKFIHAMIGYLFLNIRHTWPHLTHFNPQQIPLFQFLWPHMTPFPLFLTTYNKVFLILYLCNEFILLWSSFLYFITKEE